MYDKSKKYVVALGKSLTSKKGVISEGEPIIPKYFTGNGMTTMEVNIEKKFIVTEGQFREQCHYKGVTNPAEGSEEPEDIKLPAPRVKTTDMVTPLVPVPPIEDPPAPEELAPEAEAEPVKAPEPPEPPKAVKAPKAGATRSKFKK